MAVVHVGNGEVAIRTDKGTYVGGDTVYGSVYVRLYEATPCRSLRLQLRGYEISEYDYQYVEQQGEDTFLPKIGQRKAKKDILRADLKLIEYPGGFPAGCHCYPFQYQLPHNLPGVFHCQHEDPDSGRAWEAVIKYSIGAFIDNTEFPLEPKLMGETPLVILDSLDCRNTTGKPDHQTASGSVRTFFCIQRGDVHLTSRMDKMAYGPNEGVRVSVDIDNQAAVDTTGTTVKLIRVIKMLGLDKSREETDMEAHTVLDTVVQHNADACPKNNRRTWTVTLNLSQFDRPTVPPSTTGSLVKCTYVIDVDVHVPWAPDIEVRQPLLVNPAPNTVWDSWTPPSWVNECTQVDVTGMCSVPPDILTSQSFSGIPGFQPLL